MKRLVSKACGTVCQILSVWVHVCDVRLPDPKPTVFVRGVILAKPVHEPGITLPGMYAGITSPYLNRGLQGGGVDTCRHHLSVTNPRPVTQPRQP